ncbi:MAG TPA: hypothetical protein IGR64_02335 [Leptolyngbyaceae cyanobacterium M65_K2018_010]|nr:hypothetical protein [Leptolyngbyaceae cyanobacterium M65_K2018_010]
MLKQFKNLGKRSRSSPQVLNPVDYDTLVQALAARANQGASWEQILIYLRNRGLTPEQVAEWMTRYGGRWVTQPEVELGQGLRQLGTLATGELAGVATLLGNAIANQLTQRDSRTQNNGSAAATGDQNPPSLSTAIPDRSLLAEVEAYLRGDFSFVDPNRSPHWPNLTGMPCLPAPSPAAPEQSSEVEP